MINLRRTARWILPRLLVEAIQKRNPAGALDIWARRYCRGSYAQDGEDLLLLRLLEDPEKAGFFVDVGAHHPARLSNTMLFYMMGWSGINIDPLPGCMTTFKKWRPRDINLELGISQVEGKLTYHRFSQPELNTFSEELLKERSNKGCHHIEDISLPTQPLRLILAQHLPPGVLIDFLTVDVEGMDMEVLQSNDWNRWRPSLILVEDANSKTLSEAGATDIAQFMQSVAYVPCLKTPLCLYFAEASRLTMTNNGLKVRRPGSPVLPATSPIERNGLPPVVSSHATGGQ